MSISIELFIQVMLFLGGLAGIYVVVITRITRLETRVQHIETTAEKAMTQLNTKLDKITEELADMRVMMENKANRS